MYVPTNAHAACSVDRAPVCVMTLLPGTPYLYVLSPAGHLISIRLASASDKRKNQTVPALQDNVEIALLDLAERSPAAKAFMRWRWLETLPFLFAFLAAALSVLWDQVRDD